MNDLINGIFECSGGFFVLYSILKLYKDKKVLGISWIYVAYFSIWGLWNLYYYPSLNQNLSFIGGLFVTFTNIIYTIMLIYYNIKKK